MTRARRILFLAAAIVLVVAAIATVVTAALAAPLDRIVVVHWGPDGQPDGWGPASTWPVLVGGTGALLVLLLVVFAVVRYPARREAAPVAPLDLRPGEVAAWTGAAPTPRWLLGIVLVLELLLLGLAIVEIAVIGAPALPILIAPVVLLLAVAVSGDYRVSTGPAGFTARGWLGWPRFHVPPADVARVAVVEVRAIRDFGGWGVRWVPSGGGRWGIVTRRGEALEVVRRDGRSVAVTVDDAATAAAVLEAYAHGATRE